MIKIANDVYALYEGDIAGVDDMRNSGLNEETVAKIMNARQVQRQTWQDYCADPANRLIAERLPKLTEGEQKMFVIGFFEGVASGKKS